ncbi:hypothetical protein [Streptomyces sp. NBC_00986]|nr:hypothetical protein OG504_30265 [Streptomyces sp. NBC_00986]
MTGSADRPGGLLDQVGDGGRLRAGAALGAPAGAALPLLDLTGVVDG